MDNDPTQTHRIARRWRSHRQYRVCVLQVINMAEPFTHPDTHVRDAQIAEIIPTMGKTLEHAIHECVQSRTYHSGTKAVLYCQQLLNVCVDLIWQSTNDQTHRLAPRGIMQAVYCLASEAVNVDFGSDAYE